MNKVLFKFQLKNVYLPIFIILLLVTLIYRSHFYNEFHFDDSHTIKNNVYIQDIKNFKKFFTDATTFSNLPQNQQYRPMVTLSLAIDYWLSWKLNSKYKDKSQFDVVWQQKPDKSFWFHFSNFFWYLVQLILMYFMFIKIFNKIKQHNWNNVIALFAVAWYGFHTAHAETINYISARSDSMSTLCIIAAFVIFLNSNIGKKYFLYLIPVVIGCLFKPTAVMFAPLIAVYLLLFEIFPLIDKKLNYNKTKKKIKYKYPTADIKIIKDSIIHIVISFIVVFFMYELITKMTPKTFTPGTVKLWQYIITQPFVMLHYVRTFFFPTSLSADTDWTVFESIKDIRFIIGLIFVILMLVIAYVTAKKQLLRPISFGILWFFIALLPTTVVPLSEVMNDHRIFYPYVGFMISVMWTIGLLLLKYENKILNSRILKVAIIFVAFFILTANAYGAYKRCEVWSTEETLWYDVTVKSPKNGRGLMNYGLTQMAKAKYDVALEYFEKAKKYTPFYPYLYVNIGILKNATGDFNEAEQNFKLALQYGPDFYGAYYYYAQFLNSRNRNKEAIPLLKKAIEISPAWLESRYLLMNIYAFEYMWKELKQLAQETLTINPNDPISLYYLNSANKPKTRLEEAIELVKQYPTPENYLTLGLRYYQEYDFEKCIEYTNEALKLKPDYLEAFNNLCSAYNNLGQWDKAIEAGKKALSLKPDYTLAKANLNLAQQMKEIYDANKQNPSAESWLNLSVIYYNNTLYLLSINAAQKALKFNPNLAAAYNNICSAYNAIGQWEKAIEACEKALEIDNNFELAKNNLKWAKQNIN